MKFITMASTLIVLVILFFSGSTLNQEHADELQQVYEPQQAATDPIIYYGQSENWLATFSLYWVDGTWFDSIHIQYTGKDWTRKVGPIEYELAGLNYTGASSSPQPLQGVASLQVSGRLNADVFDLNTFQPMEDGAFKLTVKSLIGTELLSLEQVK